MPIILVLSDDAELRAAIATILEEAEEGELVFGTTLEEGLEYLGEERLFGIALDVRGGEVSRFLPLLEALQADGEDHSYAIRVLGLVDSPSAAAQLEDVMGHDFRLETMTTVMASEEELEASYRRFVAQVRRQRRRHDLSRFWDLNVSEGGSGQAHPSLSQVNESFEDREVSKVLGPFSPTALEVAQGHLEALEAIVASLKAEQVEGYTGEVGEELEEGSQPLLGSLRELELEGGHRRLAMVLGRLTCLEVGSVELFGRCLEMLSEVLCYLRAILERGAEEGVLDSSLGSTRVVLLGPDDEPRRALERRLSRLGLDVLEESGVLESIEAMGSSGQGSIVVTVPVQPRELRRLSEQVELQSPFTRPRLLMSARYPARYRTYDRLAELYGVEHRLESFEALLEVLARPPQAHDRPVTVFSLSESKAVQHERRLEQVGMPARAVTSTRALRLMLDHGSAALVLDCGLLSEQELRALVQEVRGQYSRSSLPVVALLPNPTHQLRGKLMRWGVDQCLLKPVVPAELVRALLQHRVVVRCASRQRLDPQVGLTRLSYLPAMLEEMLEEGRRARGVRWVGLMGLEIEEQARLEELWGEEALSVASRYLGDVLRMQFGQEHQLFGRRGQFYLISRGSQQMLTSMERQVRRLLMGLRRQSFVAPSGRSFFAILRGGQIVIPATESARAHESLEKLLSLMERASQQASGTFLRAEVDPSSFVGGGSD